MRRNQPAKSPQSLTESELASPSTDLAVRKQRTEQKFDSIRNILRISTQKVIEIHVSIVQCERQLFSEAMLGYAMLLR